MTPLWGYCDATPTELSCTPSGADDAPRAKPRLAPRAEPTMHPERSRDLHPERSRDLHPERSRDLHPERSRDLHPERSRGVILHKKTRPCKQERVFYMHQYECTEPIT
jgi:hypothetical protein